MANYQILVNRVLPVMKRLVLTFLNQMYLRRDTHRRHNLLQMRTPKHMRRLDELLIAYPDGRARHEASTLPTCAMWFVPDNEPFQLILLSQQNRRDIQAVGHTSFLCVEADPTQ